jgi:hypothetical protein
VLNKAAREMKGDIKIVDNVFVKMIPLNGIGDKVEGHAHVFDHITLLSVGSVKMKTVCEQKKTENDYTAPALIITPKGVVHEFTSLTENSLLCCIHAIRDGDGVDDIADPKIEEHEVMQLLNQFSLLEQDK